MNDKQPITEIKAPESIDWLDDLSKPEQIAYYKIFTIMRELHEISDR